MACSTLTRSMSTRSSRTRKTCSCGESITSSRSCSQHAVAAAGVLCRRRCLGVGGLGGALLSMSRNIFSERLGEDMMGGKLGRCKSGVRNRGLHLCACVTVTHIVTPILAKRALCFALHCLKPPRRRRGDSHTLSFCSTMPRHCHFLEIIIQLGAGSPRHPPPP